ncbi:MAG: hypothetical protein RBU30_23100 [Polyangia bacterium]|jgi:cysteine-rich repeat protein|nr:hypothetical protein [Polyangia bacterium]
MRTRCQGAGCGGRGFVGLASVLVCAFGPACVYDWPTDILRDGGGYVCGNGILEPGEACDGSDLGGESCGTQGFGSGQLSCGLACALDTSACHSQVVCGDGWIGAEEECDDGGNSNGDGCSALCRIEAGWSCAGEPSVCASGCGNGVCYAPEGENSGSCPEDCGWSQLAAGQAHTCGVKGDGSVWCWGDNSLGQLGDGSAEDRASPARVEGLGRAVKVALGAGHSCALTADETVWCWGGNAQGQLGDGSLVDRPLPVLVEQFEHAVDLGAGESHTCAATSALGAFCWGRNAEGQLGNGELLDRHAPVPVAVGGGLTWARGVACGARHSCAVGGDDSVFCWGRNTSGQLGTGNYEDSLVPRAVASGGGLAGARLLTTGAEHSCALDLLGALWCWGKGGQRRLGDGGSQNRTTPVAVMTVGEARDVAAGGAHSCAVNVSGGLYCWGSGTDGQLGITSTPPQSNPVLAAGISGGGRVAAGSLHSCAILEDRSAWCWGAGAEGQLGHSISTGSATAVPVTDPL